MRFLQLCAGWLASARKAGGRVIVPLLFVVSFAAAEEWQVNEGIFFSKRSPQLVVNTDGDAFVGYYDDQNKIIIRPYNGKPVVLNAGESRGQAAGLVMATAGSHLYAGWREQRNKETVLLLRHSPDKGVTWENEIVVDNVTQALTRIKLAANAKGQVYIAWLGEHSLVEEPATPVEQKSRVPSSKKPKHEPNYHVYARQSPNQGKTWGETQRLTEGYTESIWPTLLSRGEHAYSFSWSQKDGKKVILFTKTQADGAWQTPTVIQEVNDVLILKPFWIGERLLVLWLNQIKNDFVIEGAFSDNEGQQWTPFVLEGSRGLDIANLELAAQGSQLYIVFSARTVQRSEPWQQTVYLARSQDGGANWEKPQVLRHYPFPYTKAVYPRIVAADEQIAVVWNDFRNIRGDLYLNYLKNAGDKWLSDDLPLDKPGLHNDYLDPFAGAFAKAGDHYFLLAPRYRSDSFAGEVDLFLHRFELPEPAAVKTEQADAPKLAKKQRQLRETAIRLWDHLLQGDYKAAYPMFDPFFRANLREVDYLASTGRIKYRAFAVKDIDIYGNVAQVRVDFEYEIPEMVTKQGKFSRPLTKASAVETWVYVLDKWYKEYRNEMGGFTYTRY